MGVLSFNIGNTHSEDIARKLNEASVAVRAGFHCAPLAHIAMGTTDSGTVRVSLSHFSTEAESEKFVEIIKKLDLSDK